MSLNWSYSDDKEIVCPYCESEQMDSWELGDVGEGCGKMECGECGKEFHWNRRISVSYNSAPIDYEDEDE